MTELQNLPKEIMERERTEPRKVLLFGQGPVIDMGSRTKASEANTPVGQETINFWGTDLALAAVELYKAESRVSTPNLEFIVMGGRTGGDKYASEASLIQKLMTEQGIPADKIKTEEYSTDTIENIVNYLNLFEDDSDTGKQNPYDIVSAPYHATRLRVLMKLFAMPVGTVFRSDSLLRHSFQSNLNMELESDSNHNKMVLQHLNELDQKLDLNNSSYYNLPGTEARTALDRFVTDDVLIRELVEHPEKWLSYVVKLKDGKKIEKILYQAKEWYTVENADGSKTDYLKQFLRFDVTDDIAETKTRLSAITYGGIPSEQFSRLKEENVRKHWPDIATKVLDNILNR